MTCGSGAISTKLGLPLVTPPRAYRYSFDVLFCPPSSPFTPEGARWQEARLCFSSDDFSKLRDSVPLARDRTDWNNWTLRMSFTSRDGIWLANLSRNEAAAFTGPDSVIRVIGWVHPERDSIKSSRVFYVKNGLLWTTKPMTWKCVNLWMRLLRGLFKVVIDDEVLAMQSVLRMPVAANP
ncbi:hypothetical protein B0T26DRAFT_676155 [Lasiosphaeria miniovina]|uniref:Uncharacterized protein n=1 Tax=Lasiosphaeria miniovina TaxID=1954250 RepID=A0AA40DY41_9PEZI|nr:uncharacterized protein B0T26DRAFT_676155 [Lasiosphaeria miniovina]KAK0717922.1 hypothetical protein B0T26DRAFT_676155 [Lasiosphaeria miniovina]